MIRMRTRVKMCESCKYSQYCVTLHLIIYNTFIIHCLRERNFTRYSNFKHKKHGTQKVKLNDSFNKRKAVKRKNSKCGDAIVSAHETV